MRDIEEYADAWLNNPYTKKLLADYKKQKDKSLLHLLNVSQESTDPKCRAAYVLYGMVTDIVETLEGRKP
jgi:hypothetical protein